MIADYGLSITTHVVLSKGANSLWSTYDGDHHQTTEYIRQQV